MHLKLVRNVHMYSSVIVEGSETYINTHPIQYVQTSSINAREQGQ